MGGTVNMKLEQCIQIFEKILFQKNVLITQAAAKKEGVVNQGTSFNKKKNWEHVVDDLVFTYYM